MKTETIITAVRTAVEQTCQECRAPKTDVYQYGCPRTLDSNNKLPSCCGGEGNRSYDIYRATLAILESNGELTEKDHEDVAEFLDNAVVKK